MKLEYRKNRVFIWCISQPIIYKQCDGVCTTINSPYVFHPLKIEYKNNETEFHLRVVVLFLSFGINIAKQRYAPHS